MSSCKREFLDRYEVLGHPHGIVRPHVFFHRPAHDAQLRQKNDQVIDFIMAKMAKM